MDRASPSVCPSCGAPSDAGALFCTNCGSTVLSPSPPPPGPTVAQTTSPIPTRSRPADLWKQPWVPPAERARLRRLNAAFYGMFFAGLICLGGGAAVLPPAWTLGTEAVIALGLMAGGILLMVSGMIANIRMRTLSAVLAEAHRRELESESGTAPPASLGSRLMAPGAVSESVVEMAPFLEARNRQVHSMKPRATGLLLAFAALGGLLLILAAESFLGGDPGSGIGFALIGVLAAIIAGVWTLILYAPRLPTHPVQLRVDSRGVSLSRSRGPGTLVLWATPSLRLFLIDTRPSVRRPTSDGSPALFLYETTLGVVPLTVPGMDAVKQQAQQQGLQVDQLPQGSYGNLPLRRRMSLPFGSIVTVLSRQ